MNVPELALHHQRLDQRAAQLRAQIERLRTELASDPVAEGLERQRAEAEAERHEVGLRMREREREVEGQRSRLRGRERELMSGRIRNPTELQKLDEEVRHLKTALGKEEDVLLDLMERQETLEADLVRLGGELEAARGRTAAAAPELRQRLERWEGELSQAEAERDETWGRLPADWQAAYLRVQSRQADPISTVVGNQCQACRVALTSSGMQVARRAGLLQCDNCGRILVVA
jgi:predicted  nucleic acid-binding Zn-ribbon protein